MSAPVTSFVKCLQNFPNVQLAQWEKKTVTFILTDEDFTYVDVYYQAVKLPGDDKIMINNLGLEIKV